MRKGKNKESVDKINQVKKNKKKNTRYPPKRIRQEKNLSRNENRNKTTKGTATTSNT